MTQQSHYWAYTLMKSKLKKTHVPQRASRQSLQQLGHGDNPAVLERWAKKLGHHSAKRGAFWVSPNEVGEAITQSEDQVRKRKTVPRNPRAGRQRRRRGQIRGCSRGSRGRGTPRAVQKHARHARRGGQTLGTCCAIQELKSGSATAWTWGGGLRGSGHVHLQRIHADVWQKPTQHCKAIILQLKINF